MKTLSEESRQKGARALVLGAFAILLALGRLGFWAVAFVLGLVMEALRPGRLYCMRLCPVRAAHGLAGAGPGGKNKKAAPPRLIKALGRAFITAFLLLFGISLALGIRGRLFPAFVVLGILLSFVLSLQTVCSSFCPMGSAFVLARRISSGIQGRTGTYAPRGHRKESDSAGEPALLR